MDFSFSEQQELLRASARQFLERECPPDLVRRLSDDPQGYSADLWQKMAELGWLGLVLPESYGGSGLGFVDLTILMEKMGRLLLPAPFFSSIALGALTLLATGSDEQCQQILPRVARGEAKVSIALLEADEFYDPRGISMRASIRENRATLHGTKLFVPDAQVADCVMCVARTRRGRNPESGLSLFMLDMTSPGIACTPLISMDQTRRLCELSFTRVGVSLEAMLGGRDNAWPILQRALDKGTVALCAEMVGGAEKSMEMCVEYGKTRVQFGRQIGGLLCRVGTRKRSPGGISSRFNGQGILQRDISTGDGRWGAGTWRHQLYLESQHAPVF